MMLSSMLDHRITLEHNDGLPPNTDACLLAASIDIPRTGSIARELSAGKPACFADVGTGIGTVSLLVAARFQGCRIVGLDTDPDSIAIAQRNVARNGYRDRITMTCGDILSRDARTLVRKSVQARDSVNFSGFDAVFSNPPWYDPTTGTPSPIPQRNSAKRATLTDTAWQIAWLDAMATLVAPGGYLHLILPAFSLPETLRTWPSACGDLRIMPIYSRSGQPAKRVLLRGRKDDRSPARLLSGLVLHKTNGHFSAKAERLFRDGDHLAW